MSSGFARSHFLATLTTYVRALDRSVQLPGAGGMLWHLEEEALRPGGLIAGSHCWVICRGMKENKWPGICQTKPYKVPTRAW